MTCNGHIIKPLLLFTVVLINASCLERISFNVGELNSGSLVISGNINDQPGPHTVYIHRASNVDDNLLLADPFLVKKIQIIDNLNNAVSLEAVNPGTYQTDMSFHGVIGRNYHLRIELFDGDVIESDPDQIPESGNIDSLYFQFESIKQLNAPNKYGFRVFVDGSGDNEFIRWKLTGIYKVLTYPERRQVACNGRLDPFPCSGYEAPNGILVYKQPCECCYCWVSDYEDQPHLNDREIVTNGTYKAVELGFVPFNSNTFSFYKYLLKVEQMSISSQAYEFWKIIRDQKTGLTSLFQPSFGKVKSNFKSLNSDREVLGFFMRHQ